MAVIIHDLTNSPQLLLPSSLALLSYYLLSIHNLTPFFPSRAVDVG